MDMIVVASRPAALKSHSIVLNGKLFYEMHPHALSRQLKSLGRLELAIRDFAGCVTASCRMVILSSKEKRSGRFDKLIFDRRGQDDYGDRLIHFTFNAGIPANAGNSGHSRGFDRGKSGTWNKTRRSGNGP